MLGRIDELVVRNAENLRWALVHGIDEAFRGAVTSLLSLLDAALGAARGVIEEALQRRRDASYVIGEEVKRLKHASHILCGLASKFAPSQRRALIRRAGPIILPMLMGMESPEKRHVADDSCRARSRW